MNRFTISTHFLAALRPPAGSTCKLVPWTIPERTNTTERKRINRWLCRQTLIFMFENCITVLSLGTSAGPATPRRVPPLALCIPDKFCIKFGIFDFASTRHTTLHPYQVSCSTSRAIILGDIYRENTMGFGRPKIDATLRTARQPYTNGYRIK